MRLEMGFSPGKCAQRTFRESLGSFLIQLALLGLLSFVLFL